MRNLFMITAMAFWFIAAQADQTSNLELEPCINGGVSASGTYPTQAAEDLANAHQAESEFAELALEPRVNAGVSRSGRYPSQLVEDVMDKGTASSE